MADQDHKVESVGLLAGLSPAEVADLIRHAEKRHLEPQEILIEEGTSNRYIYFVVRGLLEIGPPETDVRFRAIHIADHGAGSVIGEYSAFDRRGASARVTARLPTDLLQIDGERFLDILEHEPRVGNRVYRNLLGMLIERLRAKDAEIDLFQPL